MNEKRPLVRVPISSTLLFDMFTKGWESGPIRCVDGLPKGARFINSYFDADKHVAFVVFEHESFADVAAGEIIPEIRVMFERVSSEQKAA